MNPCYMVVIYLISDATGAQFATRIKSPVPLPAVMPDIPALTKAQDLQWLATDWRLMTAEEAVSYREDEPIAS